MRRPLALAVAAALVLSTASALATVSEPNGLVVPTDSSVGKEVQLSEYFSSVGEPLDEKADCHTTPDTFSPLCGFSGTFVLNEAGSHFGVGWYNVDPAATTPPTDIHVIVAAGAPVGTTFSGTDIRKDPAYKGGNIGFALLGGQTHYSEQKWNVVCTACTPASPWILALIYQSKKLPNAYYLGFEDGSVTGDSFANDGDFNDDVFLFTGLVCAASGKSCDTGKKGACAYGSTSCVDGKTICADAVLPAAKQCNGLDNDCDGKIDDGPCPDGTICTKGACIPKCGIGEFKCGPGLICDAGVCVEPPCVGKTCPDGQTCVAGTCVDACTGVSCPHGQTCRVGVCVDPCSSLKCGADEVCEAGLCKPGCSCSGCAAGLSCDPASKKCLPAPCVGKTCAKGTYCAADGACADSCTGAKCPKGQLCKDGGCVADPLGGSGDGGVDGGGKDGGIGDGSLGGDATIDLGDAGDFDTGTPLDLAPADDNLGGSCGCRVPARSGRSSSIAAVAFGAMALVLARRGRRR